MDNLSLQPEQPSRHSLGQTLPALIGTYLAILAVIAYPVGLFTLWTQIWKFYTHDSSTAMYAVSLIPVPAAAGRALAVLDLLIYTGVGVGFITMIFAQSRLHRDRKLWRRLVYRPVYQRVSNRVLRRVTDPDEGLDPNEGSDTNVTLFSFLRSSLRPSDRLVFAMGILYFLQAALLPLVFAYEMFGRPILASSSEYFLYACYLVLVCLGGAGGAFLLHGKPPEKRYFALGFVVIYAAAILAAMALIPLQQPSLPVAEFSDGPVEKAILISHQEGYWYVLQEDERSLTAIPDDATGMVNVSNHLAR